MSSGWLMFIVAAAIVASIMIHEWGHLVTARRFGMRADRFFLGFGPTIWSTRRGETEYGVKLFWIGGFVRIKGMAPTDRRLRPVVDAIFDPEAVAEDRRSVAQDDPGKLATIPAVPQPTWERLDAELRRRGTPADLRKRMLHRAQLNVGDDATPAEARRMVTEIISSEVVDSGRIGDLRHRLLRGDEGRFFGDRPAWQRAIVLASGAAMHFVQAFILLFIGLLLFGESTLQPAVAGVVADTPASAAGFESGDRIVAADGATVSGFERFREIVRNSPDEAITVTIERGGSERVLTVVPEATEDAETGETIGFVGIEPEVTFGRLPASEALYETFLGNFSVPNQVRLTFVTLGRVFGPEGLGAIFSQVAGEEDRNAEGAMSLVGVARVAPSGTAVVGPVFIFLILASVNVFVGVFNVLPLPPLDGGHLLVLGIEGSVNAVRRQRGLPTDYKVDPRTFAAVALPVILVLGTLSLALVWLDVVNPITIAP